MARLTRHGVTLLLAVVALLAAAAGASAAAPTAITGPVTAVGATTATATGTVNPGGVATTWYVEYGTSTSYGSKTASASAGSGTANSAVSVALTGLAAGTTYHYRVVATSSSGTSRGSDGLFKTLAAPGAVTGSASSISVSGATLNGTVDPNASETTWWFEYGTSTSYGSKTAVKSAGSGTGPDERLGSDQRAAEGPHLPLQARCDQRRRDGERRRCIVPHQLRSDSRDRSGLVDRADHARN